MPIVDPKLKIYNLLVANWNPTNTSTITPKIHMGWYNTGWESIPQITVTTPIYSVFGGGTTGVSAITGSGGLVRHMQVTMMVSCWAHHKMEETDGTPISVNPRQLTYEFSNEVRRIMETNMFTDAELDWLNWLDMTEMVDNKIKPTLFRYTNTVRLMWKETQV